MTAIQSRRRGIALLLVLILFGASTAEAAAHPVESLRVLDFNIHTGIGADGRLDLARTAAAIRASGADVAGLQEVDVHWSARSGYTDQAAELARLTGMSVYFAPVYDLEPEAGHTERRRFGVAVLSKWPIVSAINHQLTRLSTVDGSLGQGPGFAEAEIAAPGGIAHVYLTHLDFRADPSVRATQVAETVRILDQRHPGARQLLLGDFNAGPLAPELAPLLSRMRDAWTASGSPGSGFTYPAASPSARIDYVTSAGPLRARTAEVLDVRAADHRPVLATFAG